MPKRAALVPAAIVFLALSTPGAPTAGDNQFTVRHVPVGREPSSVEIADVNRDGKPDLVAANAGSHDVTVLLGDGRGGFTPGSSSPLTVHSHPHPHGVAAADFDGDGHLDLVTDSWGENKVTVLFGDGKGGFTSPGTTFDVGPHPYQHVRARDLNGDGRADIVTADSADGSLTLFLSEKKADSQAKPSTSARASKPAAASAGVSFPKDVQPVLSRRCQPCHFPKGKMYEKLPFDDPATVRRLGEQLFTRIKDEKERDLLRAFFASTN